VELDGNVAQLRQALIVGKMKELVSELGVHVMMSGIPKASDLTTEHERVVKMAEAQKVGRRG
jgi:hypothetical protein